MMAGRSGSGLAAERALSWRSVGGRAVGRAGGGGGW